jgi:hypothetical protein
MPLLFTAAEKGITGKGVGYASVWTTSFLLVIVKSWFPIWVRRWEDRDMGQ